MVKEKTWWDLTPREKQEYLINEYERYERISEKKYSKYIDRTFG